MEVMWSFHDLTIWRIFQSLSTYVLEIVEKWEGKMVLRSAPMRIQIKVCMTPLYRIKKRGNRRLVVILTSLGKM